MRWRALPPAPVRLSVSDLPPQLLRQSLMCHVCVLWCIHTMQLRFGDWSAGGSVPSPSQLDWARTRFSTKIGSITNKNRSCDTKYRRTNIGLLLSADNIGPFLLVICHRLMSNHCVAGRNFSWLFIVWWCNCTFTSCWYYGYVFLCNLQCKIVSTDC